MTKVLMKRDLFLAGNHLLGAVLFYEDASGRPCLKFSIQHKMVGDLWVQERKTGKEVSFLTDSSRAMSVDVSYKFADNLLEIKTEAPGERPRPLMTEVPTPPQNYLFLIQVRDWGHLPVETPSADAIVLETPWPCKELVIFVSFAGVESKPFMPESGVMKEVEGRTIVIDLPLSTPYDKIWIGIGEDSGNTEQYPLTVKAPNYRTLE
jgi:hypothetical protein